MFYCFEEYEEENGYIEDFEDFEKEEQDDEIGCNARKSCGNCMDCLGLSNNDFM